MTYRPADTDAGNGLKAIPIFAALALLLAAPAVRAAEPQIPVFWDARERLPKPDLSQVTRLRFLTTTDFPPFNFLDSDGRLTGFHVDLARAICNELGIVDRCQIQALPWDELDAALKNGDGEAIAAGIAISAQSRDIYTFTRSFMRFPGRFVTRTRATMAEPIVDQTVGKRVGVLAGTAHERMLRDYFPAAQPVTYTRQDWLFSDLKQGKVDAVFGDGMRLGFWLAGADAGNCCAYAGGPYLAPEYLGYGLAIATRPQDTTISAALDYALREVAVKGVFAELYLRYFPVSFY